MRCRTAGINGAQVSFVGRDGTVTLASWQTRSGR